MGALILKSQNSLNSDVDPLSFTIFEQRVVGDGGVIVDKVKVIEALRFLESNNISRSQAVSVTSAQWAIKTENGYIRKIYSLLNKQGDILIEGENTNKVRVDNTHGFDALYVNNGAVSTLEIDTVVSASTCIVHKPISYGYSGAVAYMKDGLSTLGISFAFIQRWNNSGGDASIPSTWIPSFEGKNRGVLKGLTYIPYVNWATDTFSQVSNVMKRFNNGVENASTQIGSVNPLTNAKIKFGELSGAGLEMYIAESWILDNVSHDFMQKLSKRVSNTYK